MHYFKSMFEFQQLKTFGLQFWKEMYKVTFLELKIKLKWINNKNFKPDDSDEDDDNSNS